MTIIIIINNNNIIIIITGWLSTKEATYLYDYLKQIGDKQVLSLSYAYSSHHDDY
jgi:hypothetical protein